MEEDKADMYQAELASLNSISSNATKILTEKLALERELASLRPEIEHLRSQTSINNTVLSEKLALQRQVSQLEVELETERRASERAGRKDTAHAEAEESATSQLDELRKELAKEKRDAQKRQNEFHRKQGESESTVASYESKIESLRANLRSTKEQLRRLKEENQSLASKVAAQKLPQPASRPGGPNARKRDIARFDPDATIGTPGAVTDAKRIKRLSTLPGDKSTFSITPFLNRTTGKDAGDSDSEVADTSVCERAAVLPRSSTGNHNDKVIPEQSNLEMDKTLAGNVLVLASEDQSEKISVSSNSANGRPKVVRKHKLKDQSSLPQIQEDKDEAESAIEKPSNAQSDMSLPVKVKRKKLGGGSKTLFDEDDVDEAPARKKAMPFVSRGINLRPGGSAGLNKNVGLLKGSSFGSFSPLKRDRKIAQ